MGKTWVEIGEARVSARVEFDPDGLGYEPFQGIHSVIYLGTEIRPTLSCETVDDVVYQIEQQIEKDREADALAAAGV